MTIGKEQVVEVDVKRSRAYLLQFGASCRKAAIRREVARGMYSEGQIKEGHARQLHRLPESPPNEDDE